MSGVVKYYTHVETIITKTRYFCVQWDGTNFDQIQSLVSIAPNEPNGQVNYSVELDQARAYKIITVAHIPLGDIDGDGDPDYSEDETEVRLGSWFFFTDDGFFFADDIPSDFKDA